MYDVIVVGARCAGSPTAMLLARKGYRVLLVDKATFPSDITRGHNIWQPGIACLKRWGLLEQLIATNCPPHWQAVLRLRPRHPQRLTPSKLRRRRGVQSTAQGPRPAAR
jgi:2-polyprenyl-6-methoxyphenol hydroxylase-like FAD-dependent oxidoreductase